MKRKLRDLSINIPVVESDKNEIVGLLCDIIEQINGIGYSVNFATLDNNYVYCAGHGLMGELRE